MSEKGGMPFEDAVKKRGSKMAYLWEPPLNVTVADRYKNDTSCAWIEVARFYYTLVAQERAKSFAVEHGGKWYYWVSYSLVISRLWHFGIRSKSTVSRAFNLLCQPSNGEPPLLQRISKMDQNGHLKVYYAKTPHFDALFSTDVEYASQSETSYQYNDEDSYNDILDPIEGDEPSAEVPAEDALPAWFDAQWQKCHASGKFKACSKTSTRGTNAGGINKYAKDFAFCVQSIADGTFYDTYGKAFKSKPYKIPADLTIDSIVDGVIESVSGQAANPYAQILLYTANRVTSPYLKWLQDHKKVASTSARSPMDVEESLFKTDKRYMYIWDLHKDDGSWSSGWISDFFMEKYKWFDRYDPRIVSLYWDMNEVYTEMRKSHPAQSVPNGANTLLTIMDMAEYRFQKEKGDIMMHFWSIVMNLPIYVDKPLWRWFVSAYKHRTGSNICHLSFAVDREHREQMDEQMRDVF